MRQAGKPARIIAKMNGLVEPEIIQELYKASQAGVKIDLIVRAMCSLRPGVPGLSENITGAVGGRALPRAPPRSTTSTTTATPELYLSSADWMERNLFRRVGGGVPGAGSQAEGARGRKSLQVHLRDNCVHAKLMQPDGQYVRKRSTAKRQLVSQAGTAGGCSETEEIAPSLVRGRRCPRPCITPRGGAGPAVAVPQPPARNSRCGPSGGN